MSLLFLSSMICHLYSKEYYVFPSSVLHVTNELIRSLNSHVVIYTYVLNDTAVCCSWFPWYITNCSAHCEHSKINLKFKFNENVLLKYNGGFSMKSSGTLSDTLHSPVVTSDTRLQVMVRWISVLLCVREIPGLNVSPKTSHWHGHYS